MIYCLSKYNVKPMAKVVWDNPSNHDKKGMHLYRNVWVTAEFLFLFTRTCAIFLFRYDLYDVDPDATTYDYGMKLKSDNNKVW